MVNGFTLGAGKLRHRLVIQELVDIADSSGEVQDSSGAPMQEWQDVVTIWGAIEPLSAREFITAQSEQSKVIAKITIRARAGITAAMRIFHMGANKYYNIEGLLFDSDSGKEYLLIPVSEGIRYKDESVSS
jgi:SPP1 family predicted phage head-tail adaptor